MAPPLLGEGSEAVLAWATSRVQYLLVRGHLVKPVGVGQRILISSFFVLDSRGQEISEVSAREERAD